MPIVPNSVNSTVSLLAEVPEHLHESMREYLALNPDWDQDRLFAASLSLFLLQNGNCDRRAARIYLDSLFKPA